MSLWFRNDLGCHFFQLGYWKKRFSSDYIIPAFWKVFQLVNLTHQQINVKEQKPAAMIFLRASCDCIAPESLNESVVVPPVVFVAGWQG